MNCIDFDGLLQIIFGVIYRYFPSELPQKGQDISADMDIIFGVFWPLWFRGGATSIVMESGLLLLKKTLFLSQLFIVSQS